MKSKVLFILFVAILANAIIFGQTGQSGSINGIVTVEGGEAVPGVAVTLESSSMVIQKMTSITNENGQYRFLNLPPGKYKITFENEGMATFIREGIVINVNVTATVNIQMILKQLEETILVKGQAPTIDKQSTTKVASMDVEFLNSIPTNRNLGNYVNLAPGVNSGSSSGGSVRENLYALDGVNMGDPVTGGQSTNYSMDIMEEIAVETSGVSAQYYGGRGAIVNVITKSGGNKLRGSISGYYSNKSLKSDNTQGTPLEQGGKSGNKFAYEPVLSLGGPIIKDRFWFYLGASYIATDTEVPGYPTNNNGVQIPNDLRQFLPYVKLTYQPSQNDKIALSWNFSTYSMHHRGASQYATEESTWVQSAPQNMLNLQYTHSFGSNLISMVKIGFVRNLFNLDAKKNADGTYHTNVFDYYTYNTTGSYGYNDHNIRSRYTLQVDNNLFVDNVAGNHEIKFGVLATIGYGRWSCTPVGPTDSAGFINAFDATLGTSTYYKQYYLSFDQKMNTSVIGGYIEDHWNLTSNIILNVGLRLDSQSGYLPKQGDNLAISQGDFSHVGRPDLTFDMNVKSKQNLFTWTTLAPRLGLIYDILGDAKLLFKASYSRYYAENQTHWFSAISTNNWVGYTYYPDWNYYDVYISGQATKLNYKNYKAKSPYTDEITIGIEKELFEDWSAGLRYIQRWDKRNVEDVNAKAINIDKLMSEGVIEWNSNYWRPVQFTDTYDGTTKTIYEQISFDLESYIVNPPGLDRNFKGVEFTLRKRFARGWQMDLSYVWSKSTGIIGTSFNETSVRNTLFDNPNRHINASGNTDYDRPHVLKLSGLLKGPWGINISGAFQFTSGDPYARIIRAADIPGGAYWYNSSDSINATSKGSYRMPNYNTLDVRLEKEFKISENFIISIFADAFNVLNNDTITSIWNASSYSGRAFQRMLSLQSPRIIRFGTKIDF